MISDDEVAQVANALEESCSRNRKISQSSKDYWRSIARDALTALENFRARHNAEGGR